MSKTTYEISNKNWKEELATFPRRKKNFGVSLSAYSERS